MSTNRRIYLDHNATSPLIPAAAVAMAEAMKEGGNPSSIHAEGRAARDRVERARAAVSTLVGRPREQIVFTSGGTEANTLGIAALAAEAERRGRPRVVATTAIEHPSLRGAVEGLRARGWEVRPLEALRTSAEVGVAAFAVVNHELGTLEPLVRATAGLRSRGVLVHLDAVQAAGKLPLGGLAADALAISAHKLGGPQGVGALTLSLPGPGDDALPAGAGHQERGRRAGTENVVGIAGFGAAAAAADPETWSAVAALGAQLERGLLAIAGVRIHGADAERIGGTVNAGFAGALGESIVVALDLAGVAAATGAACSSGSVRPSPVLLGLGYTPDQAREAVRFSLGRTTTADEITTVLALLPAIVERARRHR